jgi:hypothetical protein
MSTKQIKEPTEDDCKELLARGYTPHRATVLLQSRRFTPEFGEPLDCSESIDLVIIKTLRIVQAAVNKAIKEGAAEVRLNYVNILDIDKNPDGMSGGIRVIGFRNLKPET